jgi:hypothetical protein
MEEDRRNLPELARRSCNGGRRSSKTLGLQMRRKRGDKYQNRMEKANRFKNLEEIRRFSAITNLFSQRKLGNFFCE